MKVYQFLRKQLISYDLESVWNFISSPRNLEIITPEFLEFKITSQNLPDKIYPGQIILYQVKPFLNISTTWATEITHIRDKFYFVDEQRVGPYKMWHHEHILEPVDKGVEIIDRITYCLPYGFIGKIFYKSLVLRQLNKIFDYRKHKLQEIFNILNHKKNLTIEV